MENWCEYVSQDGEIRNILQFFCECEDLDETFTYLVSSSSATSSTTASPPGWKRVLDVAQDRARVPWPGGARRVDLAWFLAAALLWLVRLAARRSTSLAQTVAVVAACFGGLGYSHLRALRGRSRSQFHVAWLSLSVVGLYSTRYRGGDVDTELHPTPPSKTADVAVNLCLFAMVACYGHCCLTDPGRDKLASGEGLLAPPAAATAVPSRRRRDAWAGGASVCVGGEEEEEEKAEGKRALRERRDRRRSLLLRSGRCSICRCTFRMRDHHCVWVGQCVAERNRRSFLGFLILLAGLSFWFSRRVVMALSSGEMSACRVDGRACKQAVWPHVLRHLLRTNRGGEDVVVAIYVLTAGLLATALAAQQFFLVSAGLTSLELRRARKSPALSHARRDRGGTSSADRSAGRSADYSRSWQSSRRSPAPGSSLAPPPSPSAAAAAAATSIVAAAVGGTHQPRAPPPPARFVSARDVAGNWARFLTGTELPSLR